jgi:hypothetical protein
MLSSSLGMFLLTNVGMGISEFLCTLGETNYLVNEWIDFDSFKWTQVEMKENCGPIVPFI